MSYTFTSKIGISQLDAIALNKLARTVEKLTPLLERKGGSDNSPTREKIIVKITDEDGSTPPKYTGIEQSYTPAGEYENKPNGRYFDPDSTPIYERNGNRLTSFPVYAEIDLRILVNGLPTYEFSAEESGTELRGLTFTSDTDSTADSDPGAGLFKWNNATQSAAGFIYFDNATADGISCSSSWSSLGQTGYVYLQQADDATKWQKWQWTAAPVDGTGYYKFAVSLISYGGAIEDGKLVLTEFIGLPNASATSAGIVTTGTQDIAGDKTFKDDVAVEGTLEVDLTTTLNGNATLTGTANLTLNGGSVKVADGSVAISRNGTAAASLVDASLSFHDNGGTGELNGWIQVFENETNRYIELRIVNDAGTQINSLILDSDALWVNGSQGGTATTGGLTFSGGLYISGSPTFSGAVDFTDSVAFSGDISPAQLTADVDDWSPAGW